MALSVEPRVAPAATPMTGHPRHAASLGLPQLDVELALFELRAGRAVALRHRGGYTLVAPASLASAPFVEFLEQAAGSRVSVALPRDQLPRTADDADAIPCIETPATRAHAIQSLLREPSRAPGLGLATVAADPDGVLKHGSAAEGALDLVRLAELGDVAIVADIVVDATADERLHQHRLGFVCISDVAARRGGLDAPVERIVSVQLPTIHGEFEAIGFRAPLQGMEFIAAVRGDFAGAERVPVSVHEGCVLGDALRTSACGCGSRFETALENLGGREVGIVIRLEADWGLFFGEHSAPDACRTALALQVIRDLGPASVLLVDTDEALVASLVEQGCPIAH